MSKSDPDTIIDPMDVIPKYGTDALRLALISGTGAGNDQRLGVSKIVANRNFANKLWNIARYVEGVVGDSNPSTTLGVKGRAEPKSPADHWMVRHLTVAADGIEEDLAAFRFSEAYNRLYHFVWDDFADWYVEASKTAPNAPLLAYVLEQTLKLAHPFAPFLTEAIWQELGWSEEMLIGQQWPKVIKFDKTEADKFEKIRADIMTKRAPNMAKKLTKEKEAVEQSIKFLEGRLANKAYIDKAPEELVEETKTQLKDNQEKLAQLQKVLQNL
jgi:valyl-tRNA synthetase